MFRAGDGNVLTENRLKQPGAGMGLCLAHISNWTMSTAPPDEAKVTASAIPTMNSLGRGFGAAAAGVVANAARLGAGVSRETVASAVAWVSGTAVLVPLLIVLLSLRLLSLRRKVTRRAGADPYAGGHTMMKLWRLLASALLFREIDRQRMTWEL